MSVIDVSLSGSVDIGAALRSTAAPTTINGARQLGDRNLDQTAGGATTSIMYVSTTKRLANSLYRSFDDDRAGNEVARGGLTQKLFCSGSCPGTNPD